MKIEINDHELIAGYIAILLIFVVIYGTSCEKERMKSPPILGTKKMNRKPEYDVSALNKKL